MTATEIIQLLGGVTATARLLGIKPPSVHKWLQEGIPDSRLIELAGQIEIKSQGRFTRKERWPDRYADIWPELAVSQPESGQPLSALNATQQNHHPAQAATQQDA